MSKLYPKIIHVTSKKKFAEVVKAGDIPHVVSGWWEVDGSASVRASGSASIRAYGSASVSAFGSASVSAFGSASVRASGSASVSAFGSASVRASDSASVSAFDSASVSAFGSASVRAFDSASVRAFDSASVNAFDSASVRATKYVPVQVHGDSVTTKGGVIIPVPKPATAKEWCEFHGVDVTRGVATLFKALDANYNSPRGFNYTPGSMPEAPDWDGGTAECGGGLHFSPRPTSALVFMENAKKFVACPVKLADIVVIHPNGMYPEKVKAPRLCKPCYEVNIDGEAI